MKTTYTNNNFLLVSIILIFSLILSCSKAPVNNTEDAYSLHSQIENSTSDIEFQVLAEELFSPENNAPSWPEMPRLWGRISKSFSNTSSLQIGIKFNYLGVDTEATQKVNFQMGSETELIMITTQKYIGQTLTRVENGQVYFNVLENTKYIIICQYTNYLTISEDLTGKILVNGNGISNVSDIKTNITRTNYSQLIPVKADETPKFYLDTVCNEIFKDKIEKSVKQDLINLAKSILSYSNPQDRCIPPSDNQKNDPTGDDSCKEWHSTLLPSVRDWTIPRCEMDGSKNYHCVLKSKKGGNCPIYRDTKTQKLYTTPTKNSKLITYGIGEFYCDKVQNLSCQITKPESWFSSAEAHCVQQ